MKELYIQIVEELMDEQGMSYEEASEKAYPMMQDRLADMADMFHDRHKEY